MKKALIALSLAIIALDQWTKLYIKSHFALYEAKSVINGFFDITYVLNPGAAFGFLAKLDEAYRRGFFVVITIVAIAAVAYLLMKEKHLKLRLVSYTLVLAGAVGNFIDRIYMGKVVDFLLFYYKSYQWPAFNVADTAISIGIGLLMIDYFFMKRNKDANHA